MTGEITHDEQGRPVMTGFRPWMLTLILFITIHGAGTVWWASGIQSKIDGLTDLKSEIQSLRVDVGTALQVVGDHGTELAAVRLESARLRTRYDTLSDRVDAGTEDRYRAAQAHDDHMATRAYSDRNAQLVRAEQSAALANIRADIKVLQGQLDSHHRATQ